MTWQQDKSFERRTDFELSKSRPLTEVLHKVEPAAFRDDMIRTSGELLAQFPQAPMLRRFKPPTHKPRRPAMRVESVYTVTGRGIGIGVRVAGPAPSLAKSLDRKWLIVRPSDGASWPLKGIETFLLPRELAVGDKIGLLVPFGSEVAEGDLVEFMEEAANP